MRFIKRILAGYALVVVFAVGAILFILSGLSDRVMFGWCGIIRRIEQWPDK